MIHNDSLLSKPYHPVSAPHLTVNTLAAYYPPMTTALATGTMFQTAYRQITPHERSFVDWLVDELVKVAKRIGQRISLALNKPLPDALRAHDTRGYLDRPLVRAAVTERIHALAEAEEISVETLARRIHYLAHTDPGKYLCFNHDGEPYYDFEAMEKDGATGIIKSFRVEKAGDNGGLNKATKTVITGQFHDPATYLKMEMELMGYTSADNPYAKQARNSSATVLPASATAEQAGDAYAAMIGDD